MIRKLSDDSSFATNLIRQVESNKSKIADLLCTPLLVTLLVMSYKSFQELPEQLSEFYESIFQVLLQRHDGVKPGFKRLRRCPLNDFQYRIVFERLCFDSEFHAASLFTDDDIHKLAALAIERTHFNCDPDKYLEDIIKVTCLILKDGGQYRFIHRSVQEYYAAAFIRHASEPAAMKFYGQMIAYGPYSLLQQELHFLAEIDEYRYNKFFYLPYLCDILCCSPSAFPDTVPLANENYVAKILGSASIDLRKASNGKVYCSSFSWRSLVPLQRNPPEILDIVHVDFEPVFNAYENGQIKSTLSEEIDKRTGHHIGIFSLIDVFNLGFLVSESLNMTQKIIDFSFEEARKAIEVIRREESTEIDFNISI